MKITLVVVGKLKSSGGFKELEAFYRKRVEQYCEFKVIELKEKGDIALETESICKAIPSNSFVVALREEGEKMDSLKFSEFLKEKNDLPRHITFVIGGAYGFKSINGNI